VAHLSFLKSSKGDTAIPFAQTFVTCLDQLTKCIELVLMWEQQNNRRDKKKTSLSRKRMKAILKEQKKYNDNDHMFYCVAICVISCHIQRRTI